MNQVIYPIPIPSNTLITAIGSTALYVPMLPSNLAGVDATFFIGTDLETNQQWLCRQYDGDPTTVTYTDPVTNDLVVAQEQADDFILGQPRRPPVV